MPAKRPKRRSVESRKPKGPKYITAAEIEKLYRAARQGRHPLRDGLILRLMFEHGLRASELAQARRNHVKLEDGRIKITRLKGSRSTEHPLSGHALRALRAYLRSRTDALPWLIVNERGAPFTRFGFHKLVRAVGERAGLTVHPHMLRHGCGYALANKGRDTRLIQDYLGHVDIKNTVIYTETAAARFEGLWE